MHPRSLVSASLLIVRLYKFHFFTQEHISMHEHFTDYPLSLDIVVINPFMSSGLFGHMHLNRWSRWFWRVLYTQWDGMLWITLFRCFWWAPLLRGMRQRTHFIWETRVIQIYDRQPLLYHIDHIKFFFSCFIAFVFLS